MTTQKGLYILALVYDFVPPIAVDITHESILFP